MDIQMTMVLITKTYTNNMEIKKTIKNCYQLIFSP